MAFPYGANLRKIPVVKWAKDESGARATWVNINKIKQGCLNTSIVGNLQFTMVSILALSSGCLAMAMKKTPHPNECPM